MIRRPHNSLRGFTLLELLVALAVFAALAVASYGSLNSVLRTRDHTSEVSKSLQHLQMGITIMQRDFLQLIDTGVRDQYGDMLPAVYTPTDNSDSLIELTHIGWRNPANQPRSSLQRVAYFLKDNALYRRYWRQLQRGPDNEPVEAKLLQNIEDVKFEFLEQVNGRWQSEWPPTNLTNRYNLPVAIRLTITFMNETKLVRIFGINR